MGRKEREGEETRRRERRSEETRESERRMREEAKDWTGRMGR